MAKNINLNSGEWCDIVFEDRNQKYGAYRLRQSSSKRHIAAFLVMTLFAIAISVLPILISYISDQIKPEVEQFGGIDDDFALSEIPIEEQVKKENIIEQPVAPPPPPLKSTIRFTPPVITEDDEIAEEDMMRSQEDLAGTKVSISIADVSGTDDKDGIDIRELQEHKVIVEKEVQDKPFDVVEVMPEFPGGEGAMLKYIQNNLKYPPIAAETGTQGRVMIRFVVTKTGKIDDVRVMRGLDPSCDREAVRVVKSMPNWVPGKQNGVNVAVYFNLPIMFRLQN